MNRKNFLSVSSALLAGVTLPFKEAWALDWKRDIGVAYKKPPYLRQGDTIGIIAPAGYITASQIQSAVSVLKDWGYQIKVGNTIGKRDYTFGGTDEERLADLQSMLDDSNIKAIMCARGGYGCVRIIDKINWTKFKKHPKWLIGFSDVTVLHNHIHHNCSVASIHAKMCNSFPDIWLLASAVQKDCINSIKDALEGKKMEYTAAPNAQNRLGVAEGILVGGNLRTIENLTGSASDIKTDGKILFVEDTDEYLYSIDRMFWNLKRSGKLSRLKALIVGNFDVKPDDETEEFGKTIQDIVLEKVKEYNYPVCFDFPVGHQKANYALKCGVKHILSCTANSVELKEMEHLSLFRAF